MADRLLNLKEPIRYAATKRERIYSGSVLLLPGSVLNARFRERRLRSWGGYVRLPPLRQTQPGPSSRGPGCLLPRGGADGENPLVYISESNPSFYPKQGGRHEDV